MSSPLALGGLFAGGLTVGALAMYLLTGSAGTATQPETKCTDALPDPSSALASAEPEAREDPAECPPCPTCAVCPSCPDCDADPLAEWAGPIPAQHLPANWQRSVSEVAEQVGLPGTVEFECSSYPCIIIFEADDEKAREFQDAVVALTPELGPQSLSLGLQSFGRTLAVYGSDEAFGEVNADISRRTAALSEGR